ncbi:unnamed protein product [Heterosigma akashiwo]
MDFEFVVLNAPSLSRVPPDTSSFSDHIYGYENGLVQKPTAVFKNLGGDATLVVPCKAKDNVSTYTHLAKFLRGAGPDEKHSFWVKTSEAIVQTLGERDGTQPTWVSTCGTGVYWLHLRLDSRPKYYSFRPFCTWTPIHHKNDG